MLPGQLAYGSAAGKDDDRGTSSSQKNSRTSSTPQNLGLWVQYFLSPDGVKRGGGSFEHAPANVSSKHAARTRPRPRDFARIRARGRRPSGRKLSSGERGNNMSGGERSCETDLIAPEQGACHGFRARKR